MKTGPGLITNFWHFFLLCLLDILFRLFNRVEVRGREHIPERGARGVLILSNHISALDPLLIGITAMPRFSPVWWRAAAKEELFRNAFSRWVVRSIGAFPVKRGQRSQPSLDRMVRSLQTDVLLIFPEGTWSTTGELLPGRSGVGKVIYDARPPRIVPVAVAGTDRILPRTGFVPRLFKKTQIIYGAPLDLTPFYELPDTLGTWRAIVQKIMEEIGALRASLVR